MYEEVVGRGGVSPEYFFDSMTLNECAAFVRGMNRKEQEAWERTRMLMYAVVQVNSTKSLTPSKLLPFPWDKEECLGEEIDMNEIDNLRQRAKIFES